MLAGWGSKPYSGTCLIPVCTSGSTRIFVRPGRDGVHQEFHQPRLIADLMAMYATATSRVVAVVAVRPMAGGRWSMGWPVAAGRWPVANGRWAVIDGVAGGRWPLAGGQWPVGGDRWGGRWPVAGGRWLVAGGRWPVAGGRWPVAGGRWPVAGGRRQKKTIVSEPGVLPSNIIHKYIYIYIIYITYFLFFLTAESLAVAARLLGQSSEDRNPFIKYIRYFQVKQIQLQQGPQSFLWFLSRSWTEQ